HSTNTPASLTFFVMTDANRTAPDASFQVMRAGTLIVFRSDDRGVVALPVCFCSATALAPGINRSCTAFNADCQSKFRAVFVQWIRATNLSARCGDSGPFVG